MALNQQVDAICKLGAFLELAGKDPIIGPGHISLYVNLFLLSLTTGNESKIRFRRISLMKLSKINGIATYHKYVRELERGGYIKYRPSYHFHKLNEIELCQLR